MRTRLEKYRDEHPGEMHGWYVPKTGGYVIAAAGIKTYRGPCLHCPDGIVIAVRSTKPNGDYGMGGGRWPETCDNCRRRKVQAHNDRARLRMRKARTKYGPVNDLRQFNGDHHHRDDDEFGLATELEDVDHWSPRHRATNAKGMRHVREAPEDFPRGTTPGREGLF